MMNPLKLMLIALVAFSASLGAFSESDQVFGWILLIMSAAAIVLMAAQTLHSLLTE